MATVTSKGQITLPKWVRDELGLRPGSQVEFVKEDGIIRLVRRIPPEVFERWRGFLRDKVGGRSVDELVEELRGEPLDDRPAGQSLHIDQ